MADADATASAPPTGSDASAKPSNGELSEWQLDVAKLHALPSEQQGLYLLTFITSLAQHVESLNPDAASTEQASVKKELFQIITLTSPAPTRVIRSNLGRCFAGIFGKGNRKLLYESINDLVSLLSASKERDLRAKHAAAYCLGALFESAGDGAVSLSPLVCTTLARVLKLAANDVGLRSAVFRSLGKIISGIVSAIDEEVGRNIWKQARNAVSGDRSLLVQANACWCLEQLVRHTTYFDNSNDFDKLQTVAWKAMDSNSVSVRRAASSCLATVMVKSCSSGPNRNAVPRIRKPRKTNKIGIPDDSDGDAERASSRAPEKIATALSFSMLDSLRMLSTHYTRPATSNRIRTGIINCFIKIFKALGETQVEESYGDIARHLLSDLLGHPGLQSNRYRLLITRQFVRIVLERVVGCMLGETAQLNACRYLLNEIIKDYPQAVKERPEPPKQTLAGAISALTSLVQSLDAATGSIAESYREALLQVLRHPSFAVQVQAARALRALILACPLQFLPSVTTCSDNVQGELAQLSTPNKSPRRCIGYAYGLSAILSTSISQPLYGSIEVYARALEQAKSLLKSSSGSDLHISACQVEVAFIIVGGLMTLGPNFVKIHLSQLMLMWKNALPKPLTKENISQRNMLELSYLAHVRECALASIKSFLTFNQRLLTSDVSKRLSAMLQNTVAFLHSLPERKTSDDPGNRLSPAFQLQDYELMVRRRVFQCFSQLLTLSPIGAIEANAHSTILPLAVASFSSVEHFAPTSLSASIASAAGTYESIWDVGDNYGFGINGLVRGLDVDDPLNGKTKRHWSSRKDEESNVDRITQSPVCGAAEHDPLCCYLRDAKSNAGSYDSAATEIVNAAISAFALSLPLQIPPVQESMLEQIAASLGSSSLQKDLARKAAITANSALALKSTLEVWTGDAGMIKGSFQSPQTEKALRNLLRAFVCDSDQAIRLMAAAGLGRLCSSTGTAFTTSEVSWLMETIVNNREPHVRAGCALALASIHSQLGGMAAGLHIKNIAGILMSLAADTHPLVHFWALDSLARVAESAGLNFSGYVTSSIGVLTQLYASDSHNPETSGLASSNMLMDLPVTAAIAGNIDSLINVMGPDLQDLTKVRDMTLTMVRLFSQESAADVVLASLHCLEHLSLYAPGYLEFAPYVHRLQSDLDSEEPEIQNEAVNGLFSLMRRDAVDIVRTAKPGLEDRLWEVLNERPESAVVKKIFLNWLQQTGSTNAEEWIARCNTVLRKAKAKVEQPQTASVKESAAPDLQDEEVAGFATASGTAKGDETPAPTSTQELMRWQVRLFAMECLHTLIDMIIKEAAFNDESQGEAALQQRVGDVVRIAFSASTAGVAALRVVGLRIIEQILKMFGKTPDPDFNEAMLLEQYQAQITSALTPAFATDSSPELAAEAVNVCATFISTGIVRDVERMGRILKLLVSALDSFSQEAETATIGDLKSLSSNAQVMVRMAVFSAWAELQVATAEQKYLVDVVRPHIAQLVPLWLTSLREYARLRFEPDISASSATTPSSSNLDIVYAALNRQTLLKFYQDSWLSLVDAIASLIDEDSEFVFDALDSKHAHAERESDQANGVNGAMQQSAGIDYREEPVAFFFVLFGLAFESLAVRSSDDDVVTKQRNLDILQALKKILRPSVSGNAIYQEVIFAESMDLMDRMVLTESLGVQSIIVEIARNLCISHPSSRHGTETPISGENLSEDIEQLFELTRIIVLVLAGLIPGISDTPSSVRLETSDEASALVRTALQALVDVSDVFPTVIRTDLHAAILHIFVTILGTGACQAAVVPQSLPIFRRFIASLANQPQPHSEEQLLNALARMLMILKNAQRRETEASLPCEKNTLLACAILISSASSIFSDDESVVQRFIMELSECLDAKMTTRVAAGCIRTLLMSDIAPRHFLEASVNFLTEPSDAEDMKESRTLVAQTLTTYSTRSAAEHRPTMVALCMSVLLRRAGKEGPETHSETASRLLELISADNTAFRAAVGSMAPNDKSLLERILKAHAGPRPKRDHGDEHEPTIALKLNFGGST